MKALVVCRLPPRVSFFFQARGIPAGGHAAQVSRARDYPLKRLVALGCVCLCLCVCLYVRMYVRMYACVYVCMHACVCVCVCIGMYIYTYYNLSTMRKGIWHLPVRVYPSVCLFVCTYVCTYVRMYVRMYICAYVCVYVCVYACMYVCICKNIYLL